MARLAYFDVKIANGATTSAEIDLRNHRLVGIDMPAAMTGVALSFLSCIVNDTAPNHASPEVFDPVTDDAGVAVSITSAGARYIALRSATRDLLSSLGRTKLVSGAAEGADRFITLVCEPRDSMS